MFFCADPDVRPRNAFVAADVASQDRVEKCRRIGRTASRRHAAQVRWNRFEPARVLGDEGASDRERAHHLEESVMSIAIARIPFAQTPRADARASSNDAACGWDSTPLTRARIGSRLSLVDRGPLTIAADLGLVVRVRAGSIWSGQPGDGEYWLVRAGESFAARRTGLLVVRAVERSEIEMVWPPLGDERLSPGLEPISIVP
jgi:hypothetical protein